MSKLQELILELCPNGVEYKKIHDVAEVGTGSCNGNEAEEGGAYPFFVRSQNVKAKNDFQYDEEAIIIPGEGGIGDIFHYVNGKYALHQRVYRIHFIDKTINVKFIYYYMKSNFKSFILKKAVSATVTSIRKPMIEKFEIPIPLPEVQEEIVKILDHFTDLAAELQAELQARKEQYEYYRNKLLTFDKIGEGKQSVTWMRMCDLFDMRNGYTPSKTNVEYWENGTVPWFRMEDIRQNGRILSDSIQHITSSAVKGGRLFPANSFIIATTATIGEHALIIADSLANQRFTNLQVRKSLIDKVNIKFLYYYMYIVGAWCKNNTNVSGFASVDMKKFKKLLIPIPSISKQQRIVAILDKFEVLVNDLSQGLPAEVAAVQEQYEYYRNKLLSFSRADMSA